MFLCSLVTSQNASHYNLYEITNNKKYYNATPHGNTAHEFSAQ